MLPFPDLSGFSEEERMQLLTVMKKAQVNFVFTIHEFEVVTIFSPLIFQGWGVQTLDPDTSDPGQGCSSVSHLSHPNPNSNPN